MLRMLMPRSGQAYPVDDGWRKRVDLALELKGWTRADLARAVGCSRGTITHLLNGDVQQSPYVPAIHRALGWTPPLPPSLGGEAEEAIEILQQLDDIKRARWLERGRALLEEGKKRGG